VIAGDCQKNLEQAQTLATLRDTLPRLISGQLRLPDAEAFLNDKNKLPCIFNLININLPCIFKSKHGANYAQIY
jgi:hypothetical protein